MISLSLSSARDSQVYPYHYKRSIHGTFIDYPSFGRIDSLGQLRVAQLPVRRVSVLRRRSYQ